MWLYQEKEFTQEDIQDYVGFVYLITEINSSKLYIGQKVFFNKVARKPLKGKKNRRITKKFSNWEEYYGSNEELKQRVEEYGSDNYKREILRLCTGKAEMNYYELHEIVTRQALLRDDYYNSWVSCRINKNQLQSIKV